MASGSASETSFNNYTFTHQWTVHDLGARLCHPGELCSPTFDSPKGIKPATKWRLAVYKDIHPQSYILVQPCNHGVRQAIEEKVETDWVSVRLDRLIERHFVDKQGSKLWAAAKDESEVWVEAHLKTPTIVYREKRQTIAAAEGRGPQMVSQPSFAVSRFEKMFDVRKATTFKYCMLISSLIDSMCVTFNCEIKVLLLDNPVHVHQQLSSVQVPEFNLGKIMEENRRKNIFTDITLVAADKKEFRAHKLILVAQSNFFETRFSSRWQDQKSAESSDKVELADVPGTVMEVMLSYMYTGEVAAIEEVAISVLPFAEEYGLEGLRKMCEQSLAKSLTSDNVVDLLITANAHNALDLKKVSMDYISSNVVSVRKSEGWRKLKERQDYRDLWVEVLEKVAERS